jgi:hypothetical protein
VDVDEHCCAALDCLLDRQPAIQQTLAKTHLGTTPGSDGCIVLYDITSTYFEGQYEDREIVQFGYNRDGKRGREQIAIGLLTNADGSPIAVEVSPATPRTPPPSKAKSENCGKNTASANSSSSATAA